VPAFKLTIARIRGCPVAHDVDTLLEAYGLPEKDEFGVLNHSATAETVFGTIVRKFQQAVPGLDREAREITAVSVERVQVYPFGLNPKAETLEVYAGSSAAVGQVAAFLGGCLALPVVVELIPVDLVAAMEKLSHDTERYQLRSVRIRDYSHNSYMAWDYGPKFLDSEHGREFLEQYGTHLASADVRFAMRTGRANVRLNPTASFSYSCHEDDRPDVQSVLRKLV
jgi:hypothetical protein